MLNSQTTRIHFETAQMSLDSDNLNSKSGVFTVNALICTTCNVKLNLNDPACQDVSVAKLASPASSIAKIMLRRDSMITNITAASVANSFRSNGSVHQLNRSNANLKTCYSDDTPNTPLSSLHNQYTSTNSQQSKNHTVCKEIKLNNSVESKTDVILREKSLKNNSKYMSTASIYLIDEKKNENASNVIAYSRKFISSLTHSPKISHHQVIDRLVPELDETLANSSSNGIKDSLNDPNNLNYHTFNNGSIYSINNNSNTNNKKTASSSSLSNLNENSSYSKMSRQINSANKNNNSRNELTLPPIVESKSSSNFKKSTSSTRVDSGIAVDDNHASENGIEITTIEVVDSTSLKKNATSSTLNSYGKSSSNQSKTSVNGKPQTNNKITASLTPSSDDTSNKNQANKQQLKAPEPISRQNTVTTINHDQSLPLVNKQNANLGLPANNSPTQQKPIPKPRQQGNDQKRTLSLQRQSTVIENSQFLKESSGKNMLKRENTTLGNKPGAAASTALVPASRPKTGTGNNKTVVTFNINADSKNQDDIEPITSRPRAVQIMDMDVGKYDDSANALAALTLMETDDAAMNEFTMNRIMKWLEDIENCNNMVQPPSQLAWNNANGNPNPNANNKSAPSETSRNVNNNEYALSDYDSLDEQIIEYNRVVDKTFHIVHDED